MSNLLIAALAATFLVSGFEEFIRGIGKWKALAALVVSGVTLFAIDGAPSITKLCVKILATTFITLWLMSTFAPEPRPVSKLRLPKRTR
jgi:hypothetical protein